ncbi:hypothetical protein T492DRAFT_1045449 [Pavlovales sp. CCMP2436]|nr:hypothetical protein T492DRAFT_1045449 [Pavlovales sp. CCMP2436]
MPGITGKVRFHCRSMPAQSLLSECLLPQTVTVHSHSIRPCPSRPPLSCAGEPHQAVRAAQDDASHALQGGARHDRAGARPQPHVQAQ